MPITTRKPARSPCATNGSRPSWPMHGSRLNSRPHIVCLAALALLTKTAAADPLSDRQQLAGDYFVGASVFLFERTVLAAFAPADSSDAVLDAGAIVLA